MYPVGLVFVNAIVVNLRDGQVRHKPFYVLCAQRGWGHDILGIWAGDGGERRRSGLNVLTEFKYGGVEGMCILGVRRTQSLPGSIHSGRETRPQRHP